MDRHTEPAPRRTRRRAARVAVAAAGCATALLLTAGAASALPTQAAAGPNPVGTWSGTVYRTGAVDRNEMSFRSDGRVCLRTEGGGRGTGTWQVTGRLTFAYQVDELLYDLSGNYFGHVLINQNGAQVGNGFASTGVSQVYGPDGEYVGPTDARVVARRTSPVPFTC
jgi:hypothetical protein